jgi:hypothetical protein
MIGKKRWILVPLVATTLTVGMAAPALADKDGRPNQKSCGGIGREARDFAGQEGPMDDDALFAAQGPFTCDDVGGEHGNGF